MDSLIMVFNNFFFLIFQYLLYKKIRIVNGGHICLPKLDLETSGDMR